MFSELLAKFPGHSWEYIAREIIQLDSSEDNTIWLKKIYYYCVVYSISVDKEITKYIGGGNRIYEKVRSDWSKIKTLDFSRIGHYKSLSVCIVLLFTISPRVL